MGRQGLLAFLAFSCSCAALVRVSLAVQVQLTGAASRFTQLCVFVLVPGFSMLPSDVMRALMQRALRSLLCRPCFNLALTLLAPNMPEFQVTASERTSY